MSMILKTVKVAVNEPHLYKVVNECDLTASDVLYVEPGEVVTDAAEEVKAKRAYNKKSTGAE